MRLDRRRPLTAAQQFLNLRYPASPTPLSRVYAVRINYRQGETPHVFIEDPDLTVLADGRRLPHVYQQKPTRLCLIFPEPTNGPPGCGSTKPSCPGLHFGCSISRNGSPPMSGKVAEYT